MTIGDWVQESMYWENSAEYYQLQKEIFEYTLMDRFVKNQEFRESTDLQFSESFFAEAATADKINEIKANAAEKAKAIGTKVKQLIKRLIDVIMRFIGRVKLKVKKNMDEKTRLETILTSVVFTDEDFNKFNDFFNSKIANKSYTIVKSESVKDLEWSKKMSEYYSKVATAPWFSAMVIGYCNIESKHPLIDVFKADYCIDYLKSHNSKTAVQWLVKENETNLFSLYAFEHGGVDILNELKNHLDSLLEHEIQDPNGDIKDQSKSDKKTDKDNKFNGLFTKDGKLDIAMETWGKLQAAVANTITVYNDLTAIIGETKAMVLECAKKYNVLDQRKADKSEEDKK